MEPLLKEGARYVLPDGFEVVCVRVTYGVQNSEAFTCETAHTARTEPCGYVLASDDNRVMLMVNRDGSILRREGSGEPPPGPSAQTQWASGRWEQTSLSINDFAPLPG
jgi:hypothetical protein